MILLHKCCDLIKAVLKSFYVRKMKNICLVDSDFHQYRLNYGKLSYTHFIVLFVKQK